jgi:hypothetical protein
VRLEIRAESFVGKNVGPEIHTQNRADIWVHDKTRERAQSQFEVVGRRGCSAFGMIDRHHAIDIWETLANICEPGGGSTCQRRRPRVRAEHHNVIPSACAASRTAAEAAESRMRRRR